MQLVAANDIRIAGGAWTGEYTGGIKIQPDASNAYFQYHGTLFFRNTGGANRLQLDSGGNATFTGSVTATGGFSGSGANLSNVNAATLDNIDHSQFLRSDATDTASERINFQGCATNNHDTIATTSSSQGSIEVYNQGVGNDAFMSFHTGGDYALYFGLDADSNKLAVGGWSMGAVKYAIAHEGSSFIPATNDNYDLGSTSKRWSNIYTADLQLSNKGKTNDVDNTWGDYTIQEGESDLFLINNRNGKKYKFNLTEVS